MIKRIWNFMKRVVEAFGEALDEAVEDFEREPIRRVETKYGAPIDKLLDECEKPPKGQPLHKTMEKELYGKD